MNTELISIASRSDNFVRYLHACEYGSFIAPVIVLGSTTIIFFLSFICCAYKLLDVRLDEKSELRNNVLMTPVDADTYRLCHISVIQPREE